MLIGSSDQFVTGLPPAECAHWLRQDSRALARASFAGQSRFDVSKPGRTMIRMVGTLEPAGDGTTVHFTIEFKRSALLALAFTLLAAIPILVAWSLLGYSLIQVVLLLTVCVVMVT